MWQDGSAPLTMGGDSTLTVAGSERGVESSISC